MVSALTNAVLPLEDSKRNHTSPSLISRDKPFIGDRDMAVVFKDQGQRGTADAVSIHCHGILISEKRFEDRRAIADELSTIDQIPRTKEARIVPGRRRNAFN